MKKKRLSILLLVLSLCIPAISFAETIVLKSGKTIGGKITEKTDKYIKMNFQGAQGAEVTYFLKDIDHIDSTPIDAPEQPLAVEDSNPKYEKSPQEEKKKRNLVIVGDATNTYASYFFLLPPDWIPDIDDALLAMTHKKGFWRGKHKDSQAWILIAPTRTEGRGENVQSEFIKASKDLALSQGCSFKNYNFTPSFTYPYEVYLQQYPKKDMVSRYVLVIFAKLPTHIINFNLYVMGENDDCLIPFLEDFNNVVSSFRWIFGLSDDEIGNLLKKN